MREREREIKSTNCIWNLHSELNTKPKDLRVLRIRVWRSKPLLQGFQGAPSSSFVFSLRNLRIGIIGIQGGLNLLIAFFSIIPPLLVIFWIVLVFWSYLIRRMEDMETSASVKGSNTVSPFVSKTLVRFFFSLHIVSRKLEFCGVCRNFWIFWRLWRFYRRLCFGCKWTPLTQLFCTNRFQATLCWISNRPRRCCELAVACDRYFFTRFLRAYYKGDEKIIDISLPNCNP